MQSDVWKVFPQYYVFCKEATLCSHTIKIKFSYLNIFFSPCPSYCQEEAYACVPFAVVRSSFQLAQKNVFGNSLLSHPYDSKQNQHRDSSCPTAVCSARQQHPPADGCGWPLPGHSPHIHLFAMSDAGSSSSFLSVKGDVWSHLAGSISFVSKLPARYTLWVWRCVELSPNMAYLSLLMEFTPNTNNFDVDFPSCGSSFIPPLHFRGSALHSTLEHRSHGSSCCSAHCMHSTLGSCLLSEWSKARPLKIIVLSGFSPHLKAHFYSVWCPC